MSEDAMNNPALPLEVRVRWPKARATAIANAEAIGERLGTDRANSLRMRLLGLIKSGQSPRTRLRALYHLVAEHTENVAANVACKRGCSHCCYTAVPMHPVEARMIGEAVKREPASPSTALKSNEESAAIAGYHNACPFLKDNECSIYEHRPLTCRVHFNLDEDDLLCRLNNAPSLVPYWDLTEYRAAYVMICGPGLADIREYFPREEK